jgi:WD40 repeat protein
MNSNLTKIIYSLIRTEDVKLLPTQVKNTTLLQAIIQILLFTKNKYILTSYKNGLLSIANEIKMTKRINHLNIQQMIFNKKDTIATLNDSGHIYVWENFIYMSKILLKNNKISQMTFDGKAILFADFEGFIHVYDYEKDEITYSLRCHLKPINVLEVLDQESFFTGSSDCSIKLFYPNNPSNNTFFKGHKKPIKIISIINPTQILSADDDMLKVWSVTSSQCIKSLNFLGAVSLIKYDKNIYFSGNSDGTISEIDIKKLKEVKRKNVAVNPIRNVLKLSENVIAVLDGNRLIRFHYQPEGIMFIDNTKLSNSPIMDIAYVVEKDNFIISDSEGVKEIALDMVLSQKAKILSFLQLNKKYFITMDDNDFITLWSVGKFKQLRKLQIKSFSFKSMALVSKDSLVIIFKDNIVILKPSDFTYNSYSNRQNINTVHGYLNNEVIAVGNFPYVILNWQPDNSERNKVIAIKSLAKYFDYIHKVEQDIFAFINQKLIEVINVKISQTVYQYECKNYFSSYVIADNYFIYRIGFATAEIWKYDSNEESFKHKYIQKFVKDFKSFVRYDRELIGTSVPGNNSLEIYSIDGLAFKTFKRCFVHDNVFMIYVIDGYHSLD